MSVQNTAGTWVKLTPEELETAIAAACASRSITTDTGPTGWSTAVAAAFNATNASGLTPLCRQFLIDFFTKFVGVGRLP